MEPSTSHDVNLPVDRSQSESARFLKPEFAARFELGGGGVPGRLIPDLFADARRVVKLGTNPV